MKNTIKINKNYKKSAKIIKCRFLFLLKTLNIPKIKAKKMFLNLK